MTESEPLRCATHPNVETNLRCGKCGKPICPKCMVQTPVGTRCRECARLNKAPTFRVSGWYYLRASGTALGLAVVVGLVWSFVEALLPSYFFSLIFRKVTLKAGYKADSIVYFRLCQTQVGWLIVRYNYDFRCFFVYF